MNRVTIDECEQALRATGGFISQAAKKLGISQPALSKRIRRSKRLQDVRQEVRTQYLDLAESKLIGKINEGNFKAIRFYLLTQGKDRGYMLKQEIQLPEDTTIRVKVTDE